MARTLCINLLSGYQENEDPVFAVKLAEAALAKGCNMANQEKPIEGHLAMTEELKAHMDKGKVGPALEKIAQMGANISTCHTTEYGRGTEAEPYRPGIKWGDVGQSFTEQLVTGHVLITLGH